jgi:DNA repair exonuclease SbcCD nuclease subunit
MRVVFLGDCHLAARSGSSHFVEYFNSFFRDTLYPYMKLHGINTILQSGDLFDNRSSLNLKAYHHSKNEWFKPLVDNDWKMYTLVGNHDITLRESLSINTQTSLLQEYIKTGHVVVYDKPGVLELENCTIDMIPWICKENAAEVKSFMSRQQLSELCYGHFEISGANMYRGIPGHSGLSVETFARYEAVLSGHYHTRSFLDNGRINYVGTPYEITWQDCNDPRGFTVFDTVTREFEFVVNENTMFKKLYYNDGCKINPGDVRGKFVKLIVEKKANLFAFDTFIDNLKMADPYELSIMEITEDVAGVDVDDGIEIEDTHQIISSYIDGLTTELDKSKIKTFVNSLYVEAINL